MSGTVIAIVDDMFFASKIRSTAEALGVNVSFSRSKEAVIEKLAQTQPNLILVDLHNQKLDALELAKEIKAQAPAVTLLGFFSHVEVELQRNALSAGFDQVIPRSIFARNLAQILTTKNRSTKSSD
ncbi:MAG TPA: response regulator [Pyrinomonadaceae bacterium]|nr:response regulator [Pyrinomonadaceae bacterium]